jgi:hypothetical protein
MKAHKWAKVLALSPSFVVDEFWRRLFPLLTIYWRSRSLSCHTRPTPRPSMKICSAVIIIWLESFVSHNSCQDRTPKLVWFVVSSHLLSNAPLSSSPSKTIPGQSVDMWQSAVSSGAMHMHDTAVTRRNSHPHHLQRLERNHRCCNHRCCNHRCCNHRCCNHHGPLPPRYKRTIVQPHHLPLRN